MKSPALALLIGSSLIVATAATFAAPTSSVFVQDDMKTAVKWLPWGDAAFQRAKTENKPIYLHIGFFTSELSRAMAKQSFTNVDVAKFLNDNFVCVLVDRDEQPEVAALYRAYVHTVKQVDGWPINVWLTPDLKPFEGTTYLPPSEEWGKPGLMNVAKQVQTAWQNDAAAQRQKANDAVNALTAAEKLAAPKPLDAHALAQLISENADAWKAKYDATNSGFGDPPKRLEPELLRFLLRDPAQRDMAVATLTAMADGAVRDQLDGGFFHQSTDAAWRQPYFQKLASDQARIAVAYLDAAKLNADPRFPDAARGTLNYVLSTLGDPAHGFTNAQDASGETIGYYLWTIDDFQHALGAEGDAFARTLGVAANGNIPDDAYTGVTTAKKNILYRAVPPTPEAEKKEAALRAKLLQVRSTRPAPRRDSLATSGVHGLLLTAFSRAGAELKDERFTKAARDLAAFVMAELRNSDGSLKRLPGESQPAAPEDYAFVVEGLRTYAANAHDAKADQIATTLESRLNQQFFDQTGGRYYAAPADSVPWQWTRVHVPAPSPGEPSAPESTMLMLPSTSASQATALTGAIAAEVRDATDAPAGDFLLALRSAVEKR